MFPPLVRLLLIISLIAAAATRLIQGGETWFLYLTAAVIFGFEHFKGGSIWIAFQAYRKQNFEKVRKYINATKRPEWLRPSAKAYYYFLSGVISTIDEDFKKAKEFFLKAADGELRTEHLKCVTYCILADTSFHLGEFDEAKQYLNHAKTIPHRSEIESMFGDIEKRIEEVA